MGRVPLPETGIVGIKSKMRLLLPSLYHRWQLVLAKDLQGEDTGAE